MFEQSLGKPERHAYGAYFTSEADIQKVVLPSIVRPWRKRIEDADSLAELGQVERDLLALRVLDPACGSGNFLYVAYRELRRLEHQLDEKRGLLSRRAGRHEEIRMRFVSPTQFYGIDLRPFAVEVAKVTLMLGRKLAADELGDEHNYLPLDDLDANFQTTNAISAEWPEFDVCIGNPPYLGARNFQAEKTPEEIAMLRRTYPDIAGASDYVTYWFRKTHDLMRDGNRAGLVGTANIRSGDTRTNTLDYIVDHGGVIYDAVAHQPWSGDATVEVSIVNWIKGSFDGQRTLWLAGGTVRMEVDEIVGSLSPNTDLRAARPLRVNRRDPKVCFQGQTPQDTAGFVLTVAEAQELVRRDARNAAVIHPYLIGRELNDNGQPTRFIIDLSAEDNITARTMAPDAYEWVPRKGAAPPRGHVRREEERNRRLLEADPRARLNWERRDFMRHWWQLWRRRGDMVDAITALPRYIALSRVAVETRQSVYAFVSPEIRPGDALQVFAFSDDYSLGVLHSTYHRMYFEERCSKMRVDLRYTPNTVFDTFPWPQAPTSDAVREVAECAAGIVELQRASLADGMTLGALYDSLSDPGRNPLRTLQKALDAAVAELYGFSLEDDVLAQLLALNQSIAEEEATGITRPRGPGADGLVGVTRSEWCLRPAVSAR